VGRRDDAIPADPLAVLVPFELHSLTTPGFARDDSSRFVPKMILSMRSIDKLLEQLAKGAIGTPLA
jgi:hypothetical protein